MEITVFLSVFTVAYVSGNWINTNLGVIPACTNDTVYFDWYTNVPAGDIFAIYWRKQQIGTDNNLAQRVGNNPFQPVFPYTERVKVRNITDITLSDVGESDSGTYYCEIQFQDLSTPTRAFAELTVTEPASYSCLPEIRRFQNTLNCSVPVENNQCGSGAINQTWRNGTNVTNGGVWNFGDAIPKGIYICCLNGPAIDCYGNPLCSSYNVSDHATSSPLTQTSSPHETTTPTSTTPSTIAQTTKSANNQSSTEYNSTYSKRDSDPKDSDTISSRGLAVAITVPVCVLGLVVVPFTIKRFYDSKHKEQVDGANANNLNGLSRETSYNNIKYTVNNEGYCHQF